VSDIDDAWLVGTDAFASERRDQDGFVDNLGQQTGRTPAYPCWGMQAAPGKDTRRAGRR
jgi:hypothetical protein